MPKFEYKALTSQGQMIKNTMVEESREECIKKIKRNGLTPVKVRKIVEITFNNQNVLTRKNLKSADELKQEAKINSKISQRGRQKETLWQKINKPLDVNSKNKKISIRDIRVFTQDFYLLKKADFNNVHALQTVIKNTENPSLKKILEDVLVGVEAGEYMHTTLEHYSKVFPYIYINIIKVGELAGTLETSLEQAIKYLEDKDTLSKKIKRILIPNIIMFVTLIVGTIVAVLVGVPMVQELFETMGSTETLPVMTLRVFDACRAIISTWYIWIPILLVLVGVFISWTKTEYGRYKFDRFKYKMPIFGKLIYALDFSRLMQGLQLNLKNGMRIQEALTISKNVIKNTVMLASIETAINNIYNGQSWIEPFEKDGFSSTMMIEMLKTGMETNLTEMLDKLIEYINVDIENIIDGIVRVLPEVSYAFVGIVLILFTIIVLVPIIQVYMGGWLFSAYGV